MAAWTIGLMVGSLVPMALSSGAAGPYYANVLDIGKCAEDECGACDARDDILVKGSFRHYRGVPFPVYSANVSIFHNVATKGNTELTSIIDKWDRVSGWRKNYMILRHGEICRGLQLYEPLVRPIIQKYAPAGFRPRCPIPNKTYAVVNQTSRIESFPQFPIMFYGRYRTVNILRSAKNASARPLACIRVVAEVVEKITR